MSESLQLETGLDDPAHLVTWWTSMYTEYIRDLHLKCYYNSLTLNN